MSEIKFRKMPDSIYCGTIETPFIDVEFYMPKDLKGGFTNTYKKGGVDEHKED